VSYSDLREWLARVEELGELRKIDGAHWKLEMGAVTELLYRRGPLPPPAILFDKVPGYPPGFRTLFGMTCSVKRMALTLGLPMVEGGLELVQAYRRKIRDFHPIPPKVVKSGPVGEHVDEGDRINLLKFPVPVHHEQDGGRYIGTGCLVVTRDPDEGWINLGTYRGMVHDRTTVGLYISPGKHGRLHRQKYFERGQPCPVVVCVGQDPALFLASGNEVPYGLSELDYAGGFKGAPFEVIEGRHTGLPIPAAAEIAYEGEMLPKEGKDEGPFGEWTGYYASGERAEPFVRVKAIYHRDDPILTCARPSRPPSDYSYSKGIVKSALIWDQLEKMGIPNVKGVWCHEAGGGRLFNIVAIKQAYPGHARQAALAAGQCQAGAYLGRYVVVVDDDIDPTNTFDVIWAIATRSDPERSIDITRRAWSGPLDPAIQPGQKGLNSRAIIDACRPWEWRDEFPPVAEASPQLLEETFRKWRGILGL
jgi:UbiD family decarboxylase